MIEGDVGLIVSVSIRALAGRATSIVANCSGLSIGFNPRPRGEGDCELWLRIVI